MRKSKERHEDKWGKLWGEMRKNEENNLKFKGKRDFLRKSEERYEEKLGKWWGEMRKVMKKHEENSIKSDEKLIEQWDQFWGKMRKSEESY